jgi:hypothetical protein
MKYLNKIATVFCSAALGLMALTSCEGGELYSLSAPDWMSSKIDSIAANKNQGGDDDIIEGMEEDVYTVGATDFSTGWWAVFSKYYQIPEGGKWVAQFNLNINPNASNTYKNYAMIITNDEDRGAANYKEYGAIRYDNQPSGNSEWGDYIDRSLVESTLTFETDTDPGVDKFGGKVTLTIDRTQGGMIVTMDNGTVVKTYKQTSPLVNLNADESNTTIRAFLVPEGSYINWLGSTIEPIGGFTSADDKMPLSMTLNNVPKKVLQGATLEEAFANVTATVQFETGISKDVSADDLTFEAVPDMASLGKKNLVAVYAKTYKGEPCNPVIGSAEFEVVDKMYASIGATDNSTPFWGAHSENIKVAPGETFISRFTNYTNGGNNWENFVIVLCREDNTEFAVVRADNYGWGEGYENNPNLWLSGGQSDWGAWLAAMDGAKVTVAVTNNGDGSADVQAVMLGNDGNFYNQEYKGIAIDSEDFYFRYTVEKCHLEFNNVLGNEDNTTGWWTAHSEMLNVPAGKTFTTRFKNYTNGAANWNNFLVVLTREDNTEYAVLRADNYGWGDSYGTCTTSGGQESWETWLAAMDDATVTVSVTNNDDGTVDVKCVMLGNDGVTYYQDYLGISPVDANDLWFRFTIEGGHIVFL